MKTIVDGRLHEGGSTSFTAVFLSNSGAAAFREAVGRGSKHSCLAIIGGRCGREAVWLTPRISCGPDMNSRAGGQLRHKCCINGPAGATVRTPAGPLMGFL